MKLTLPRIRLFALLFSLVLVAFTSGFWFGKNEIKITSLTSSPKITIDRNIPDNQENVDFSLFWQVWDKLEYSYFDKTKLDQKKMVYGAIQGMVSAVGDPYTVFLPPDEQKRTQEDLGGEFEGVGIQIGFRGTQLAVIAPLEGSPAEKAGVRAGDFIVGIRDIEKKIEQGTVGISLPDAVNIIRGKAGSKVSLILTRDGSDAPVEVEIERTRIEVPSVVLAYEGPNKDIAHLKLMKFGDQTNIEWEKAIADIRAKNAKTMILDLRNNPGGYLNGAVFIISDFVKSGTAVIQEDGQGNRKELPVNGKPRLPDVKLVVLVNKGSASASEIVAGALKDHSRATVMGDKSFGKGTVQESLEMGESGIHITTQRWLTPSSTWVHGEGLTPNIEVADNPDTQDIDEQLQAAIRALQ